MIILTALMDSKETDFLEHLYTTYRKPMWRLAVSISNDKTVGDDIVQTSFLYLLKKAKLLQTLNEQKLKAYIFITVKNTAIDYQRQKKDFVTSFPIMEIEDHWRQPEETTIKNYLYMDIVEAVNNLPDKYMDVVSLRYIYDLSYEEISDMTGLNQGNIRVILHRALKKLKEALEGREG